MTNPLSPSLLQKFQECLGKDRVLHQPEDCWTYGYDNSRQHALPQAVLFALSHKEVAACVQACYQEQVPIVARGRGTGTPGGCVPCQQGVVLSLERMHETLIINTANRTATVSPGVTNGALQAAAAKHGFFWAPDPSSREFCTIGGNLAFGAAGPRAIKYGTTRENTLGLTAVIGTGETIHTGVKTSKGVVGYDLTRLLIGSEGTLGIITEATLKLTALPEAKRTAIILFQSSSAMTEAITRIMSRPTLPYALEMMDAACLELIRAKAPITIPTQAEGLLLLEIDGPADQLHQELLSLQKLTDLPDCLAFIPAHTKEDSEKIWATRKALSPALRHIAPKKINEDIVVPLDQIQPLIQRLKQLSEQYQIPIVNFGHAGSGNIHVNLLTQPENPTHQKNAPLCLAEVFQTVLSLGGTLSGEHGIGLVKKQFIIQEIDPTTLNLMRKIKQQFDPKNILNPGKIFPDH